MTVGWPDYVVRSSPARVVERWFAGPDGADADVIVCRQLPTPIRGARTNPFTTRVIDLEPELDDVFGQMDKSTRYKVRKAQRDGIEIRFLDAPGEELERFFRDYDEFVAQWERAPINRKKVAAMVASGLVELSVATGGPEDQALVWHTHVVTPARARLLQSVSRRGGETSEERNLVGRANRLLHWETIVRHRAAGRKLYDLGGWYEGSDDTRKLAINDFKQGFGGTVVEEFDCRLARTARGRAWELATKLRR